MLYLLLLFSMSSVLLNATQDDPAIIQSSPNSPVVISKKKSGTAILRHASRWNQNDFYAAPDEVRKDIKDRIIKFYFAKQMLESHLSEKDKQHFGEYVKWFYPHHGNLLMTAVNEAITNDDSAGFLDLFTELVQIPQLKEKILNWQEVRNLHIEEKVGTIVDYLNLYQTQIIQQNMHHSQEILQEFMQVLYPNAPEAM